MRFSKWCLKLRRCTAGLPPVLIRNEALQCRDAALVPDLRHPEGGHSQPQPRCLSSPSWVRTCGEWAHDNKSSAWGTQV